MLLGCQIQLCQGLWLFHSHTKCTDISEAVFHGSPLCTLVSHNAFSQLSKAQALFHSIMIQTLCWNWRHILKCGGISIGAHLHGVNTFWAAHLVLVVNKWKPGSYDCQMELKNIVWGVHIKVLFTLYSVFLPSFYGLRLEVTLSFLSMLFAICLGWKFVLHFQLMLSMLHFCFISIKGFTEDIAA